MATIQLRTAIPGPKSKALAERRADAVPRGLSIGTPVYVAKAEDAWLEDVDGNRYLDFAGGIGCLNVGHRREPVVTAVKNQLDRFLHTCVQVTPYEDYVRLAERMNQVTPGQVSEENSVCEQRRRSGRERGEDRACAHWPVGHHRFRRCFSRTHHDDAGADQQDSSLQGGLCSISGRCLSDSVRVLLSLLVFAEVSVVRFVLCPPSGRHIQARGRIRRCCRRDCRAGAGRRRIRRSSQGFLPSADGDLPQARCPCSSRTKCRAASAAPAACLPANTTESSRTLW